MKSRTGLAGHYKGHPQATQSLPTAFCSLSCPQWVTSLLAFPSTLINRRASHLPGGFPTAFPVTLSPLSCPPAPCRKTVRIASSALMMLKMMHSSASIVTLLASQHHVHCFSDHLYFLLSPTRLLVRPTQTGQLGNHPPTHTLYSLRSPIDISSLAYRLAFVIFLCVTCFKKIFPTDSKLGPTSTSSACCKRRRGEGGRPTFRAPARKSNS